jgi:hypothetical protein
MYAVTMEGKRVYRRVSSLTDDVFDYLLIYLHVVINTFDCAREINSR